MQDLLEAGAIVAEEGPSDVGGRKGPPMVGLVVVGLLAAMAGGWFGAPRLAPNATEMLDGVLERGSAVEPSPAGAVATVEHLIPNLVLNPAGSGGVRFLVASLALVASETAAGLLEERDAEARDLILTILSARTVEQLSDVSSRDEIRSALRSELNAMLGFEGVQQIFFPQFVIQ